MCAVIKGANGEADTIYMAIRLGYLKEEFLVKASDSMGEIETSCCTCPIDVPESLDACGAVWTGAGSEYVVHEQTELFGK